MPTALAAAGAEYPEEVAGNELIELPGQSLLPLITKNEGKFNEDRRLFWEHAGSKAVRDGKWKLVQIHEGPWELFNMDEDRSELNDLIKQFPDRGEKMKKNVQ